MRYSIILAVSIFVFIPALAFSATLKVPSQYSTIQAAIDAAVKGDTVDVAPGTYVENIDFKGKAITVTSSGGAGVTVIDGGSPVNPDFGSVVTFDSGEGLNSVLDGFFLTKGTGTKHSIVYCGGGILCTKYSSPTITNNIISGNSADFGGGGMYNWTSAPTVTNCSFTGNSANYGGGMNNDEYSSPTVTNCTFSGNSANIMGGGMWNYFYSSPTVTNCSFTRNLAADKGGGMCNHGSGQSSTSPTVTNCTFTENLADKGGGMYNSGYPGYPSSPTVTNCTFTGNSATLGGGMYNWSTSSSSPTVTNCILWGDTPDEIYDYGIPINMTYSCIQGGLSGQGNIQTDPLFVDPISNDFHLTYSSPCKDTGDNTAVPELYDFEGDPRKGNGIVDMGADEFYTHLYWTGDATPGGNVEVKFVGLPGTSPVGLCIGSGVLDPPLPSMWGDWYLKFPIIGPIGMPSIPAEGVLVIPGTIPASPPPPYSIPMQVLIGAELSNLSVVEVK